MTITIYHNPRCSKSRKTLELIRASGATPEIVEYLATPPCGDRIRQLAVLLGEPVSALLRRQEEAFRRARDLPDLDDDKRLADWLARHPQVLQRPIVVDEEAGRAIIGRPPENVATLLPR